MVDVTKFRGLVALVVNVAIAVAGALTAPEVVEALKDFGLSADQTIQIIVALGSATAVLIGAVSNKFQSNEAAVKSAVAKLSKVEGPAAVTPVVKEAITEAKVEAAEKSGRMSPLVAVAFALAAIGVSSVGGCAYLAKIGSAPSIATYDEKALLAGELAYSYVLDMATVQAKAGLLTKTDAVKVKAATDKLQTAIVKARSLYAAGNSADAALATQDVLVQVTTVTKLLQDLGVLKKTV